MLSRALSRKVLSVRSFSASIVAISAYGSRVTRATIAENESARRLATTTAGHNQQGSQWKWGAQMGVAIFAVGSLGAEALCDKKKENQKDIDAAVRTADTLYQQGKHKEISAFLESQLECACMEDVEVLWRLARAYYDEADKTVPALSTAQKKALVDKAMTAIKKAMEGGEQHFAVHKWYGIILNKHSEFQGTKATIQNSFIVKEHWLKAVELKSNDATSHALLGEWSFSVAGLSSFTRSIASAIFASPPTATYQEALDSFLKAEDVEPGFWLKNQLNIAKCYLQLSDPSEASSWLRRLLTREAKSEEDKAVQAEAQTLLKKLPQ